MVHLSVVAGYQLYLKHKPTENNGWLIGVSYYYALEVTGHTLFSIRYYRLLDVGMGTTWSSWTGWFRNGWAFFHDVIVWRLLSPTVNEAGCTYRSQLRWRRFPITQRMIADGVGFDTWRCVFAYNANGFTAIASVPIEDLDV